MHGWCSQEQMARSTHVENKITEEQSNKKQIVWLLMQMGVVVNDIIKIKQQIKIKGEKMSCQHESIARNNDACRTPTRPTNTCRTRSPRSPPTPPTRERATQLSPLCSRSTPVALSPLQSLSPLSPLYSISMNELVEMLGPDFDFDLEIERSRYEKD